MSVRTTPWTLDKTINLPFLLTVLATVMAATAWTGQVSHRMERLEERTEGLPAMEIKLARMDERGGSSSETLKRIENRLDRIEARQQ